MKFIDLRELEFSNSIQADLCIVGSGPAGATIAKEFAGSRISVLLLEGGGIEHTDANQALYDVHNVGVARASPQFLVRNRIIGGSSHTWSGRCVSLDEIDFEPRPWVSHSGWPVSLTDIQSFLDRSKKYLGLGPNIYDDRLWKELGISSPYPQIDPAYLRPQFWQYSRNQHDRSPVRFSRTLATLDASNVRVLMHANVTQIITSENGARVQSLEVRSLDGRRAEVKANVFVLACGGLENARLLLASNRIVRTGVGNSHDLVGRFLMDHPGCTLGWFNPRRSTQIQRLFGNYFLNHQDGQNAYNFGLMLSPETQRKERLLNCAAFLSQVQSTNDSWSALKRLLRLKKRRQATALGDISTVIGDLPRLLGNAYRYAKQRGPILNVDELSLYCLVEQTPDPSSRVTLAEQTDALGMPLLRIDWRIGELERRSVMRLNELIQLELRRGGYPEFSSKNSLIEDAHWRSQFIDRAHPSGTTRMAASPKQGVVDQNCRVHGVAGLYIAGSSVFPTVGHGNPTLMIVALAIRLADSLKSREFDQGYV
jgi:choline dehydrogenase-like flavoprotein